MFIKQVLVNSSIIGRIIATIPTNFYKKFGPSSNNNFIQIQNNVAIAQSLMTSSSYGNPIIQQEQIPIAVVKK